MTSEATPELVIAGRRIGRAYPPLVIAEIGINHEGQYDKAIQMVDDALAAGAECVKFQSHVVEDEMIPNDVVPGNTTETIWDIMVRCALSEDEERALAEGTDGAFGHGREEGVEEIGERMDAEGEAHPGEVVGAKPGSEATKVNDETEQGE